ncbi:MAG: hypothetical protein SFX19_05910 [Alphaproteobacteria bacterium]|nr:hypothetical protein [Alphaproteobacteria bacterium]
MDTANIDTLVANIDTAAQSAKFAAQELQTGSSTHSLGGHWKTVMYSWLHLNKKAPAALSNPQSGNAVNAAQSVRDAAAATWFALQADRIKSAQGDMPKATTDQEFAANLAKAIYEIVPQPKHSSLENEIAGLVAAVYPEPQQAAAPSGQPTAVTDAQPDGVAPKGPQI